MLDQLNFLGEDRPQDCCYTCCYFAEFKEPRTYIELNATYTVFGVCLKCFGKNSIYTFYPVYVPGGKCKVYKKLNKGVTHNERK